MKRPSVRQALTGGLAVLAGLALALAPAAAAPVPASPGAVTAGDPDFRLERLGGSDRYAAAATLSREFFDPGVDTVVIASGWVFSDGVSAGPAAAKLGAPVLFATPTRVPSSTRAELERLDPDRILVLGGPATIGASVVAELDAMAPGGATRITGADRFETSAAISRLAFPDGADIAYVASGRVWPDALTGGAAAAVQDAPMLLTEPGGLPSVVRAELERLDPDRIMLLGGTSSVSTAVAEQLRDIALTERVFGPDRYSTALAISQRVFGTDRPALMVATGSNFPDALAGSAAAVTTRGPILLARSSGLASGTLGELARLSPRTAYLLGGPASVPVDVAKLVQGELGVCSAGFAPTGPSAAVISSVSGTSSPKVAFTLDMGGRMEGAADIVRFLIDEQVCTTFFPTGFMADTAEGREVMALIAANPHLFEIGNHTTHHCDLVRGGGGSPTAAPCARSMTSSFIRSEITGTESVLRRLTDLPVRPYWRPPYGSHDSTVRAIAADAGYPLTMMWSRDTADWDPGTTTSEIISSVLSPTPPSGTIVLAHLGGYNTGAALPAIVDGLRDRGITPTSISDMIDD